MRPPSPRDDSKESKDDDVISVEAVLAPVVAKQSPRGLGVGGGVTSEGEHHVGGDYESSRSTTAVSSSSSSSIG